MWLIETPWQNSGSLALIHWRSQDCNYNKDNACGKNTVPKGKKKPNFHLDTIIEGICDFKKPNARFFKIYFRFLPHLSFPILFHSFSFIHFVTGNGKRKEWGEKGRVEGKTGESEKTHEK